jgi:hypothetical protein
MSEPAADAINHDLGARGEPVNERKSSGQDRSGRLEDVGRTA